MSTDKIIRTYGSFVKDQVTHQEGQAQRASKKGDEARAQAYLSRAAMFRQLLADLEAASAPSTTGTVENSLRLSPDEIRDLPEELLAQLSINESDKRDFLIVEIIEGLGGIASVDKILVAIFRKTGEIEKRTKLVARLYRMTNKGLVYPHPDRKGVYTLVPHDSNSLPAEPVDSGADEDDAAGGIEIAK